jgi:hypothetical protein
MVVVVVVVAVGGGAPVVGAAVVAGPVVAGPVGRDVESSPPQAAVTMHSATSAT